MKRKYLYLSILIGLLGLGLSACLVVGHPRHPVMIAPVATVVVGPSLEYGYQPLLYDGYVVYYSNTGVPFYWLGGARVWVPVRVRPYYVDHWRVHRTSYVRWHSHRAKHYRSKRFKRHSSHLKHKPGRKHQLTPKHKKKLKPKARHPKPLLKPKKKKKKDKDDKPTLRPKRNRNR